MPIPFKSAPNIQLYFAAENANLAALNATPGVNPTLYSFFGPTIAGLDVYTITGEVFNAIASLYNLQETDRQQLYDIASFTEYIAQNLPSGGGVDLSTVEILLQSVIRDTSNIAQHVGGGAPLSFTDIVHSLDQGLFEVANQIFGSSQLSHFDQGQLINSLTQLSQAGGADVLKNDIARIPVLLAQLIQVIQFAAGVGDPATQKVADNTAAAAAGPFFQAALEQISKPDADEYADWIVNSGPFALLGGGAAVAARHLPAVLTALFGTTLGNAGLVALDEWATGGKITAQVTDSALWAVGRGAEFISKLATKMIGIAQQVTIASTPAFDQFFEPIFEELMRDVQSTVSDLGEARPNNGFRNAATFLTRAAKMGLRAHHTATAMEMIPFAKQFGMHQISAFMSDMAGFGSMSSQTLGQAIGESVGRAAGYEINGKVRSRIPDVNMLEQLVFEREMTEAEQAVLLAYHGFNDDYIARIQRIQYREPNLRQLSSLAADASMTETQVSNWLQEGGFHERDVQLLTPIVMQQSMRGERSTLVSEVMQNLRAGLLDEDDAALYFDRLHLQPAAREMLLTSARLGLRRSSIEDNITTYKQLYGDGLMDDNDFRLALQSQGITDARITVELAQVANKRFGKVADDEAAETKAEMRKQQGLLIQGLRAAYQHGMIDGSNFQQTLEHAGISRAVASATVELERIKLEGRALTSRSAAAARLLQEEIRTREDTFVELFRKGTINNIQLGQFLLQIGLPVAVVGAIVERELARARPTAKELLLTPGALKAKELFTLAKAKLRVQFSKGAIDADSYLTQLVALGTDADIARATVALEVARRSGEKQPPAPAKIADKSLSDLKTRVDDALEKFAQAGQTSATLEDVLSRLGIVEEVVSALVALANEQAAALAEQENAIT